MHHRSDYSYHLPQDLIAQTPAPERSASRLMTMDRYSGNRLHKMFYDLPVYLVPGDVLVVNDTKVIPARIEAFRKTGGQAEIFLLENLGGDCWEALARPSSRLKEGEVLRLHSRGEARLEAHLGAGRWKVSFHDVGEDQGLDQVGRMPLPHYISREKLADPRDELDRERYQTVYSACAGAVAAPTAGLHFTPELLETIAALGVKVVTLTLHVGIGTFAPIREDDITRHAIHSERFTFPREAADGLNAARRAKGRIIAVGTTSVRVLETVVQEDGTFKEASGRTGIFIYPPYRFKAVDLLLTNFHLPESTLLLLVSAFAGRDNVMAAYEEAVSMKYRFYSYGDAMLLGDHGGRG